jgi:hypothetical protein
MSQYETSREPTISGWVVGGITFAGTMLILIGMFQAIDGLVAIFNDAWGWIHLLLGIGMMIAGWSIFSGKTWAAVVALTLAMLSALANFFFIPYYPLWSLVMIALDCWVIWALTRPGVVRSST